MYLVAIVPSLPYARVKYPATVVKLIPFFFKKKVVYIIVPNRNINAQDNKGYTPLHIAAGNNQVDIASLLLSKGASTTILDNNGQTAKQVAAYLGFANIAALIPN